jgi:uncharacterized protein HemX
MSGWRDPTADDKRPIRLGTEQPYQRPRRSLTGFLLAMAILAIALAAIAGICYILLQHSTAIKEHSAQLRRISGDFDNKKKELANSLNELKQSIGGEFDSRFSRSQPAYQQPISQQIELRIKQIEDRLLRLEQDIAKLIANPNMDRNQNPSSDTPTRD